MRDKASSSDPSLDFIDDKLFTKTTRYHWMIKTCHEICSSINASVKFIRIFEDSQLPVLKDRSHQYEKAGIDYWAEILREETTELDMLQTDFHAIREQVRELVSISCHYRLLVSPCIININASMSVLSYLLTHAPERYSRFYHPWSCIN